MSSRAEKKTRDLILIEKWLTNRSPNTRTYYSRVVRNFFDINHDLLLSEVTEFHIEDFLHKKKDTSMGSKKTILNSLSSLLSFAKKHNCADSNPAFKITHNHIRSGPEQRVISKDDILAMAEKECERNSLLIQVLFESGAKVDELLSLRVDSFGRNGDQGCVFIKNKVASNRIIPISDKLIASLESFWISNGYLRDDFFIKSPKSNGAFAPSQVLRIIKNAAISAGIKKNPSAQWIRHSRAFIELKNGKSLDELRSFMGFESMEAACAYKTKILDSPFFAEN